MQTAPRFFDLMKEIVQNQNSNKGCEALELCGINVLLAELIEAMDFLDFMLPYPKFKLKSTNYLSWKKFTNFTTMVLKLAGLNEALAKWNFTERRKSF